MPLKNDTTSLDYDRVSHYWNKAQSSILGPYMMEGFGFPKNAGYFRFHNESKIVQNLTRGVPIDGVVLDLGCGTGHWSEFFSQKHKKCIAVEASESLFNVLRKRCDAHPNIKTIFGNSLYFEPRENYELVFLGGMLMYLNEEDVTKLLKKLIPWIKPNGTILCRETTLRKGSLTRQGNYQAVYRSVDEYETLFKKCGLSVKQKKINVPYILIQMGCEIIKKWKKKVPTRFQILPVVGFCVYWGLRLGNPWITRLPKILGKSFPYLTNHFFLLEVKPAPTATRGNA